MMVAYHIFTIGGLVVAVVLMALAIHAQIKVNRWWQENFEDLNILEYDTDEDVEPELSAFDQEVADLTDDPLD